MSEHPPHGAHTIHAKPKGGGMKWLLGAAVAAVLVGGGYYAWTHRAPDQPATDIAQNEPAPADFSSDTTNVAPESAANETPTPAAPDESAPLAAPAETQAPAPQHAHRRATPVRTAAVVPEETIGVTPVSATTTDSEEVIIHGARRPVWVRTPSARRLAEYYPDRALERGREGEASVHCTIQDNGALDCVPISETPAHSGFGTAALRVARTFRHAPQLADGSSAAGSPVNLHVVFRMADDRRS